MQELQITRSFRYNSITLPDPHPGFAPDQVREFYATQYPELNNALVEGPVTRNAVATYTFIRAAGAKGTSVAARSAQVVVQQALAGEPAPQDEALFAQASQGDTPSFGAILAEVATRTPDAAAAAMPLPSAAFGLWG